VRRIVAAAMAGAALVVGACENDSADDGGGGYAYAYHDACHQFASCGTCTPVNGCGWCFDSNGTGICAASPDECATPVFSWTWNPSGCRVPADAGAAQVTTGDATPADAVDAAIVVTEDASGEADAAPLDAASPPADASTPDL
jgi:hypothetical protein